MNLVEATVLNDIVSKLARININILRGRLERGGILKEVKAKKLYVGYDSWVTTWAEFLDTIRLNRETARQDMEVYDAFSHFLLHRVDLLESCSYERLVRLLPLVRKDPNKKSELLEMTAKSRRVDFDNNLKELKGLTATDTCKEHFVETQLFERCVKCGQFRKVNE
tara:strand:- start:1234 stop:1731 length:498 start_codon:yes stop_codon:yes gene_type:complete